MIIQSQFSEFSYGYAMTEHLVRLHGGRMRRAPKFPTLRREAVYGYDVRITGFGWLQFKRADGHDGPGIKERRAAYRFTRDSVIYRMLLSTTGNPNQHDKLLRLEQLGGNRAIVLYACPAFAHANEFNQFYGAHQIEGHSMLVKPGSIGQLDNERHHVSFNQDSVDAGFAWCFSDPIQVVTASPRERLEMFEELDAMPAMTLDQLHELQGNVSELFLENGCDLPAPPEGFGEYTPSVRALMKIAYMLRSGFDIEPLVLGQWVRQPPRRVSV